jgi:hypothetical protein
MWDGGDCRDGVEPAIEFLREDHEELDHWSAAIEDPDGCASNCADGWLADKFCDAVRTYFIKFIKYLIVKHIFTNFAELQHGKLWL